MKNEFASRYRGIYNILDRDRSMYKCNDDNPAEMERLPKSACRNHSVTDKWLVFLCVIVVFVVVAMVVVGIVAVVPMCSIC